MSIGLLFNCDEQVASQVFSQHGIRQAKFDACLGLVDGVGIIRGGVFFSNWNGFNVELSYFGQDTMTAGIIRCLARYIVCTFDPSRLTVTVMKRNKRLIQALHRIGFRLEGVQRCFYGKRDCNRNTGVRLVMFRDQIEKILKMEQPLEKVS